MGRSNSHAVRAFVTVSSALTLALAGAASAAAAKPVRFVAEAEGFVAPAGENCTFAVSGQPDEAAGYRITRFSDGRTVIHGRGDPTLTNLETGTSLVHHSRYTITETVLETGELLWAIRGQIFMGFWEGDHGPFGVVGGDGALISVNGHARVTVDPDTFVFNSFELTGSAIDLCAQLA